MRSLLSFLLSYYYFKRYRCRLDYEDDVFKNDKILFYLSQKGIILYFFKIQFIIQIVNFFISFYSMQIKFSFPFLLIHRSFIYRCIYNFEERVDRERFIHFFLPMILQINYLSKYKNIIKKKKNIAYELRIIIKTIKKNGIETCALFIEQWNSLYNFSFPLAAF